MKDVAVGRLDGESGNYGQEDSLREKFYDGKLIQETVNAIKFVNPERSILSYKSPFLVDEFSEFMLVKHGFHMFFSCNFRK